MRIKIIQGDITAIPADAIVNAANSSLLGGGGVDGAIHRKGGKAILDECVQIRNKQGGCKTGEAVITTAGELPAKYVIHTVGPVWNGGDKGEAQLLADCYNNSIRLALQHQAKTLSFPSISTGIYKFPKELAAKVVSEVLQGLSEATKQAIDTINLVCFDAETAAIYNALFADKKPIFLSELFDEEPQGWGLRGDPHFWKELKQQTAHVVLPDSVERLEALLHELFEQFTGEKAVRGKNIFVEKLNKGGMSGGVVSSDFWLDTAFPLVVKRYLGR